MMKQSKTVIFVYIAFLIPASVSAQPEPMESVRASGHSFAYHVVGDGGGTPLLLINGGPGLDHQYLHLTDVWDRFALTRRVVFFDQPGTGQSSEVGPRDTISVADIVEGIEAIRRDIGAERLAPLGHSWGGYLAVAYSAKYPDSVERLVLVAPQPPRDADMEFNFAALWPDSLARGGFRTAPPERLQRDIRRHVAMSIYSPEVRASVLSRLGHVPFNRRQSGLLGEESTGHDLSDAAFRLPMPVLVATGRFDANVAPSTSWKVHRLIPGSKFKVWEESGHYPMVEEPEAFFRVVEGFLTEEAEDLDYSLAGMEASGRRVSIAEVIIETLRTEGIEAARERHRALRAAAPEFIEFGEDGLETAEDPLNTLGYELLQMGFTPEAVAVFEMNVDAYPQEPKPHDSLGDGYSAAGRLEDARRSYERAIELAGPGHPNLDTYRANLERATQQLEEQR